MTTKIMTVVKGAIVGGLISFFVVSLCWTVVPFHKMVLKRVDGEARFSVALKSSIKDPGVYVVPSYDDNASLDEAHQRMQQGPFAFMAILPEGKDPGMGLNMLIGLLTHILVAGMISYLLTLTNMTSYLCRVCFVKTAALAGTILVTVAEWNWWGFSCSYALLAIGEAAVVWGLAGLGIAKVVK